MTFRAAAASSAPGRRRHRRRRRRAAGDRGRRRWRACRPRAGLSRHCAMSGIHDAIFDRDVGGCATPASRSRRSNSTAATNGPTRWSARRPALSCASCDHDRDSSGDARRCRERWRSCAGNSARRAGAADRGARCVRRAAARRGCAANSAGSVWNAWVAVDRQTHRRPGVAAHLQKIPNPVADPSGSPTCRISTSSRPRAAASARALLEAALGWCAPTARSRGPVAVEAQRDAVPRHGSRRGGDVMELKI